jgi:hypothetical protein
VVEVPHAVIFVWDHEFNAVIPFGEGIGTALQALDFQVTYVNTSNLDNVRAAFPLVDCDLAISIGAWPMSIRVNGKWLHEVFGKTFCLYMLDPIFYDVHRVEGVLEYVQEASCSDRLKFLAPDGATNDLLNQLSPGSSAYYPFAGFFTPYPEEVQERSERLLLVGTIGMELEPVSDHEWPQVVALGTHLLDGPPTLSDALCAAGEAGKPLDLVSILRNEGMAPRDILTMGMCGYLAALDAYQKRRRRILAVTALRELPFDIYGTGWEQYGSIFKDARFLGPLQHERIGPTCRLYSAMLNLDPNWDHGLHPRAYTALGHGCKVITNESLTLQELGSDTRPYVRTFDANQPAFDLGDFLARPAAANEEVLRFRRDNSYFARTDRLFHAGRGAAFL